MHCSDWSHSMAWNLNKNYLPLIYKIDRNFNKFNSRLSTQQKIDITNIKPLNNCSGI